MKFITPIVLALGSTLPITANAWCMGRTSFPSQVMVPPGGVHMMRRRRAMAKRFFRDFKETQLASPRYELIDNDEKFQLSVDVPGVKADDIDVSLEDGFLTVTGQRLASDDSSRFTSKFSETFSLDSAVDVEKFTASLNDGVLVITAPKDFKRVEENVTKIPIMQGEAEDTQPQVRKVQSEKGVGEKDVLDLDNEKTEPSGENEAEDPTA
eukprot:scaffold1328_cov108-Cylindrotheca_fusiformis.AAC.11